jgi:hypothetical protein
MATRTDYLERPETQNQELVFLDKVLEGWAVWANQELPGPNREQQLYVVLSIAVEREGTYCIRLSDDDFVHLEQCIKALPERYFLIVDLEYRNVWMGRRMPELSQEQKWRLFGGKRSPYRDRLKAAQSMLYGLMLPEIGYWQLRLWKKT